MKQAETLVLTPHPPIGLYNSHAIYVNQIMFNGMNGNMVRLTGIEHAGDVIERAIVRPMRTAVGVADGTGQIAGIADLDQRQAAVLHVVGTEAAVVGAAPALLRVEALRQFGCFDEHLARLAVVVDVVGDEHAFAAMLGAPFLEVDLVVLEQNFRFDAHEAGAAHRDGTVVEQVRPYFCSHASVPAMRAM